MTKRRSGRSTSQGKRQVTIRQLPTGVPGLDEILGGGLPELLTSLIGVLIIVTRGNLNALLQLSFNHGDVIIIVNMIVFAIYAAYLRLRPKIHWMSFLFVLAVVSAVGTMPFAIFELASGRIPELNVGTITA